jgi:hypothetical protein
MRIAHLIMAHKGPAQLERLIRALAHPQADVFIHLDQKTDAAPFAALAALPQVRFITHRFNVKWGGYSLTLAALESMREMLQAADYDFLNVLSGEDYPIKPIGALHEYLTNHMGCSFLEYDRDDSPWWQANRNRVAQYHFTEFRFPGRYLVQRVLNRLLPSRKVPLFPKLYGGNMGGWYTVSRACATYAIDFVDAHPELRRFAWLTWGSDEFLVHSILLNSPLANTITNDNLRYIDWSGGGPSPKILTSSDLPALLASSRFFARKFDISRDAEVLNRLDQLQAPATLP